MSGKVIDSWPVVFVSDATKTANVSRYLAEGKLRKLGSRLYTKDLTTPTEGLIRKHLWEIVAGYYPDALISDRTALENSRAEDGSIFFISERTGKVDLPGIHLRPRKGVHALPGDLSYIGGTRISSQARAYLENMRPSRARKGQVPRTLTQEELEQRLERLLRTGGEPPLQRLRDDMQRIAKSLQLESEAEELNNIIGALLGTRTAKLRSDVAIARAKGQGFDPECLGRCQLLYAALRNRSFPERPAPLRETEAQSTLCFFDAYFSNYIEGTRFEVSEAEEIVFQGKIPEQRPADGRDILATYRVVSQPVLPSSPGTPNDIMSRMRTQHSVILEGRKEQHPGEFKQQPNMAGDTRFVEPELVAETLRRGFELQPGLKEPLARAMYTMFLITEVHPFTDGNGRVARAMMNSELIAAGQERILIPTAFRDNYLQALRALSRNEEPEPFMAMLEFAQRWTAAVPWTNLHNTRIALKACHAFDDTPDARLRMP